MQPNQPDSYLTHGFNMFMERDPRNYHANDMLNNLASPFINQILNNGQAYDPFTSQQMQADNPTTSADNIQGGVLTSNNGNLVLDLNAGTINYNDGAVNLFNVGGVNSTGTSDSLTINNAAGQQVVGS